MCEPLMTSKKIISTHKESSTTGLQGGHTAVFDTGSQKSMIGRYGWEIVKRHDTWIDAQGVNMGGYSKEGRRLQLLDDRSGVKTVWMGSAT